MQIKTLDENFRDWENSTFGYGYGNGESHILPLLQKFLALCPIDGNYNYLALEQALTPAIAWMFINILCKTGILEYGTSPCSAWLSTRGKALKQYTDFMSVEDLILITTDYDCGDYIHCAPDVCNCGPRGHVKDRICPNPFWYVEPRPLPESMNTNPRGFDVT